MQTERVTFLATPDQKAALEAFASANGKSVGHVVREAASRYIAQEPAISPQEEELLAMLVTEVNALVPEMEASLDRMSKKLRETNEAIEQTLREAGIRK